MGMHSILLADRITATAYHLAGVEVRQPAREGILNAFRQACQEAGLVLITRPLARTLPNEELSRAIKDASPPVQVIDPVYTDKAPPDAATRARRALGVSS